MPEENSDRTEAVTSAELKKWNSGNDKKKGALCSQKEQGPNAETGAAKNENRLEGVTGALLGNKKNRTRSENRIPQHKI
jgi:hypothetical protein